MHCLVTDGAYEEQGDGELRFLAAPPPQLPLDFALSSDPAESSATSSPRPRRIGWAKLLARVFALDVTRCRTCGGRMRTSRSTSAPDRGPCVREFVGIRRENAWLASVA